MSIDDFNISNNDAGLLQNGSTTLQSLANSIAEINEELHKEGGLSNQIKTNAGNITQNTTDITNLKDTVSTNASNITQNTTDITNINAEINNEGGLRDKIKTNASNITNLKDTVNTNASNITNINEELHNEGGLSDQIKTNAGNITQNTTDITNLKDTINTNASNITQNTTDITNLKDTVDAETKTNKTTNIWLIIITSVLALSIVGLVILAIFQHKRNKKIEELQRKINNGKLSITTLQGSISRIDRSINRIDTNNTALQDDIDKIKTSNQKLQDNINQINTNNKTNINEQWLTDWLKKNNNLNTNDINKIIDDKLNNTLSGAIDQKINNRDFIANLARRGYGTLVQEMKNNAVLEEEEEMNNRYNGCACQ